MTVRTDKLNTLIGKELSALLSRELEWPVGVMVSVTNVEVSPDLGHAKVGVSVLPNKYRGSVKTMLLKKRGALQKTLAKKLVLRKFPKLSFYIDDYDAEFATLSEMIDSLET